MAWWVGCIINILGSISINLGTVSFLDRGALLKGA
jgi:hypothetical protein